MLNRPPKAKWIITTIQEPEANNYFSIIHDALELQSEFHPEQPRVDKILIRQQANNSSTSPSADPTGNACYRCGGDSHATHNCRFKDQTCYHCGKVGHIASVCRSKLQGKPKQTPKTPPRNTQVHTVEYSETDVYEDLLSLNIHNDRLGCVDYHTWTVHLWRNEIPLQKTELLLQTYTGENITLAGVLKANVEYKGQQQLLLDQYVVKGNGPVLMGRDWLYKIRLDWCAIKSLNVFTSYTTCQRASGHHTRRLFRWFWR